MKISLISLYSDITSLGIRSLSSVLKRAGHTVELIFLPHEPAETLTDESVQLYSQDQLHAVANLCRDSSIIGISVMTNYFSRAVALTTYLKQHLNIPVIWGGIHPTIRPIECLHYADMVCVGEGEDAMVELAETLSQTFSSNRSIANIFVKSKDDIIEAPVRPLLTNLDDLPYPDYEYSQHYVWDQNTHSLVQLTLSLMETCLAHGHISRIRNQIAYQTIATRGCPHNCSYCCNNVLRELYKGQPYLRRRSLSHLLGELEQIRQQFPFVKVIGFSDDSFFAESEEGIQQFAIAYKQRIDLPFFCLGSPLTITRGKLEALLTAGLFGIQMGIQTGSTKTKKMYHRSIPNETVLEAAQVIHEFKDRMIPPTYDFIIDNPMESREDLLETLELMLALPRPNRLQLFSLVVFPETGLYHHFVKNNVIQPFGPEAYDHEYHHHDPTYLNLVLSLARNNAPRFLLRFLAHPAIITIADRPAFKRFYKWFYSNLRMLKMRIKRSKPVA